MLCFVFFLWTFLHPLVSITTWEMKPRGTFFDENSLLPHSSPVDMTENIVREATLIHQSYIDEIRYVAPKGSRMQRQYTPNGCGLFQVVNRSSCANVIQWLKKTMADYGMIARVQNFPSSSVLRKQPLLNSTLSRQNVYVILHPKRGADRKETIVLSASFGTMDRIVVGNDMHNDKVKRSPSGIALGLSLLLYLSQAQWLSKNIIFVAVDGGSDPNGWDFGMNLGAKAWIDEYMEGKGMGVPYENTLHGPNETFSYLRGGSIVAAVCLDVQRPFGDTLKLSLHGLQGALPNMDFINIITKLHTGRLSFSTSYFSFSKWFGRMFNIRSPGNSISTYLSKLLVMFQFIFDSALCPSPGGHAHFLGYSIESFTLCSFNNKETSDNLVETLPGENQEFLVDFTSSIQRMFRCLSNMSEDFHNSFWNYLLLSRYSFVAYGEYAWVLVIGTASLFLSGFKAANDAASQSRSGEASMFPTQTLVICFFKGVWTYLFAYVTWFVCGQVYSFTSGECTTLWWVAHLVLEIAHRGLLRRIRKNTYHAVKMSDWKTLKSTVCIFAWMCHGLGILNYGMWFLSCSICAPVIIGLRPSGRFFFSLNRFINVVFSPFVCLGLFWYYNFLSKWFVEHFTLGTMHFRCLCFVYIPITSMIHVVRERCVF